MTHRLLVCNRRWIRSSLLRRVACFAACAGLANPPILAAPPATSPATTAAAATAESWALRRYLFPLAQEVSELPRLRGEGSWELVLSFTAPWQVDSVLLGEDPRQPPRVQGYVVQAMIDGQWKQVAAGTAVGQRKIERFPPVRASGMRVRFTGANGKVTAKPAIERFAVFSPDWSGKSEPQAAFLGVPEGNEGESQTVLPAGARVTRVEPASFEDYAAAESTRRIEREEVHRGFVYYAVRTKPDHEPGAGVVNRYKAKLPDKGSESSAKDAEAAMHDWKFLGVPDGERAHPARQPIIMSVKEAPYRSYLADQNAGRIIAQERHDKWVYWAVEGKFYGPQKDGGEIVYLTTERYRAPLPSK